MKSRTKIFIASLIFTKILIGTIFMFQLNPGALFPAAIASESAADIGQTSVSSGTSSDDTTLNIELLVQERDRLKEKEKELEKKYAELTAFQADIDKKIRQLTELRSEIKVKVEQNDDIERQKIKQLIKAYSAMKAQSAADLLEKLDEQFAIKLLSQMKGEDVGKILTYVDKNKAAKLIEGIAGQ